MRRHIVLGAALALLLLGGTAQAQFRYGGMRWGGYYGPAYSGWSAGSEGLFRNAAWVVSVDDHVDPQVWAQVMHLALDCHAIVVPARSDEHDAAAATISHLPHLLAEALAATAGEVPLAF